MKEKKKYIVPEAEIIDFKDNDIITISYGGSSDPGFESEPWKEGE